MNPNDTKLDRDLRDFPVPEPPQGLLEKLKADIPDTATLAGKTQTTESGPRRWPLRLAATFILAAVGATVAWQIVKSREGKELDRQEQEFQAPAEAESSRISPPPPPPPLKAASPKPASNGATDAGPTSTTLTESFSVKDELSRQKVAQPVEVPAAIPEAAYETKSASAVGAVEGGVEGGVVGGVGGGVVGGVYGGAPGGVPSAAPASPPATSYPAPARVNGASPKPGFEGFVDKSEKRAAATAGRGDTAGSISNEQIEKLPLPRDWPGRPEVTTEPDTMIFRETPEHRFVHTDEDRLSTFALDVDTGSYTLARSYLDRGVLPPPAAIRVEEFVNAQQYDTPAPRRGDFALYAEGAPAHFYPGERTRLVRFAVKAREIDERDRKPAVLTFVVDVSGSMNQENRLGLVKRALGLLLDELRPEDRVGLVVYGTNGRILLHHTRDLEEIRRAISELRPEGSTNVEEGLRLGYDLADEGWRQGASNRILLCSDGVANVGATGPESILGRIGKEAQRGIALTTIGFGMGNYNDALMEQLADQGDGTYHYVDALAEARKVFVENLTGTLETVAKEAKAQVEFDSRAVLRWRLLGYENRDVADRDFRNDRIDAGELGAGHQATALYEVRLREGVSSSDRIATFRLRWKSVASKRVEEVAFDLRARDLERDWQDASANFHHAALAAAFAEKLKQTAAADDFGWRSLWREARGLEGELRRNRSAVDLTDMIDRAARIAGADDRREDRDERNERDERRLGGDDDEPRHNPRLDED